MWFKSDFGFVGMEAKGDECGDDVGEAVAGSSVSCVLQLEDVFHLSEESFNEASFPQQNFILQKEETLFPVGAEIGDEKEPSLQECFDEVLRDVPLVSNHFSLVITNQMELKTVKPSQGRFCNGGQAAKHTMTGCSLVAAHGE